MRYSVNFTKQEDVLLRQMAREAGVGTHDIIEIAAYNLMALFLKDRQPESAVSHDGLVDAGVPDNGMDNVPLK